MAQNCGDQANGAIDSTASVLLQGIVDGTPIPTFVIDLDHRVTHWNRACEAISGIKAADVVGTTKVGAQFYPDAPDHPVMAELIVDRAFDARIIETYAGKCRPSTTVPGGWEVEDFFPHFPDGGKWVKFSATALHDAQGNLTGAIETFWDITKEKQALQALTAEKQRLNEIINGCSVPLFVMDGTHKITHWNRACEIVTGILAKDVVGTNRAWSAFYPTAPDHPVMADLIIDQKLDDQVNSIYAGKCHPSAIIPGSWEAEDIFPHFNKGCQWLAFSAAALRDSQGRIIGAVETLRDTTQERQAMDALRDAQERQKSTIHNLMNERELAPYVEDNRLNIPALFQPLSLGDG